MYRSFLLQVLSCLCCLMGWSAGFAQGQQIATGFRYTLVVKPDGTLWGWGENDTGQRGDGTTTRRTTPIQIGTVTTWHLLTTVGGSTFALRRDGTLWGWGWGYHYNKNGQFGDSTKTPHLVPVRLGKAKWRSISTGGNYTVAVRQDGTLWGWGDNTHGQLGDSTITYAPVPRRIGTSRAWQTVVTNFNRTFALRRDGTLWAWGDNTFGKLGGGRYTTFIGGMAGSSAVVGTSTSQKVPLQIGQHRWQSISVNREENLGIRRDGTLWLWGTGGGESAATMHSWGGGDRWHSVATNKVHSLAIRADSTLWAWGYNKEGQLGDSTLVNWHQMPVKIGHGATWVSVATNCYDDYYNKNYAYSVALQADGTLWTWGDNTYGQLGDGSTSRRRVPVRLPTVR